MENKARNSIACTWQYSSLPDRLRGSNFEEVSKYAQDLVKDRLILLMNAYQMDIKEWPYDFDETLFHKKDPTARFETWAQFLQFRVNRALYLDTKTRFRAVYVTEQDWIEKDEIRGCLFVLDRSSKHHSAWVNSGSEPPIIVGNKTYGNYLKEIPLPENSP